MSDRIRSQALIFMAATAAALLLPAAPPAEAATVTLVPHRAVYDLKLLRSQGRRPVEAVRGRILYDFAGNSCEGYALRFRQVSELDGGEGKVTFSDLRATTWEDGSAKNFRFASQNFLDSQQVDVVDGRAERKVDGIAVTLTKPREKNVGLDSKIIFPAEHMRLIIEAALEGKTLLELPVYDGSETGEKVFNTLTVIGHEISPTDKPLNDASAKVPALAKLRRWPVTISYFDKGASNASGEQTPVYAIGFELFENGISRNLSLDYGDFVISGEMNQLEVPDAAPCK